MVKTHIHIHTWGVPLNLDELRTVNEDSDQSVNSCCLISAFTLFRRTAQDPEMVRGKSKFLVILFNEFSHAQVRQRPGCAHAR